MELTLSLAHFCDNHGPISIICTQALPISCFSCYPSTSSSCDSLDHIPCHRKKEQDLPQTFKKADSFDFADAHGSTYTESASLKPKDHAHLGASTHPRSGSSEWEASTTLSKSEESFDCKDARGATDTATTLPIPTNSISRPKRSSRSIPHDTGFSSGAGPACTNCMITLPSSALSSTNSAASASSTPSSTSPSSSPRLRSKFPVRVYTPTPTTSQHTPSPHTSRYLHPPSSFSSTQSEPYPDPDLEQEGGGGVGGWKWHEHTQIYISTHSPLSSPIYSSLRTAIMRVFMGETLPRGLTSGGRMFFGHEDDGYVVPYTFRLHDRYARGGVRKYCCVALFSCGGDDYAAGGGLSTVSSKIAQVWAAFEALGDYLIYKATLQRDSEENLDSASAPDATPAPGGLAEPPRNDERGVKGSFLTSRKGSDNPWGIKMVGPEVRARNLTEITGDERVFAKVHMRFVELMKELGPNLR